MAVVIETARLILRHLIPSDLEPMVSMMADAEVMRFIGAGGPIERERIVKSFERSEIDERRAWPEETLHRLPQLRRAIERETHYGQWTTVLKSTDAFIGRCGLIAWDLDGAKETEVAYMLDQPFWGHGYATEAARAIRDYAFARLGFTRLISLMYHDNVGSQRVAKKNGMTYERDVNMMGNTVMQFAIEKPLR